MSEIKVRLDAIKAYAPKKELWSKIVDRHRNLPADYSQKITVSSILESNGLADTLWVLRALPEHDHLWRSFVWRCASSVELIADDDSISEVLQVVQKYYLEGADDLELSHAWQVAAVAVNRAKTPQSQSACRAACFASCWSAAFSSGYCADYASWALIEASKSSAWALAEMEAERINSRPVLKLSEKYLNPQDSSKWKRVWDSARAQQANWIAHILKTGNPLV